MFFYLLYLFILFFVVVVFFALLAFVLRSSHGRGRPAIFANMRMSPAGRKKKSKGKTGGWKKYPASIYKLQELKIFTTDNLLSRSFFYSYSLILHNPLKLYY